MTNDACKLTAFNTSQSTDPYTLLVMPPQKTCQNLLSRVLQFNRAEKTSDKEYRAVFPYGTFYEEGLREFLKMHEAKQTAYEVQCEREWFNAVEPIVNRPLSSLNRQQLHLDDISASA